jgi:hypothetical protein
MSGALVASVYMDNIPAEVVRSQRAVLEALAPADFELRQVLTRRSHGAALDEIMAGVGADVVLVLDIDCVPLTADAIPALAAQARAGGLAGCVQRANHIDNGAHLYVGAFCLAIGRPLWERIGRPSFQPTGRGDVGEELTYRCEAAGAPVTMLWPSRVEEPCWDLTDGRRFGVNSEYDGAFLHTFNIRSPQYQHRFIDRCREILASVGAEHLQQRPGAVQP